jgi:hypothetical protein
MARANSIICAIQRHQLPMEENVSLPQHPSSAMQALITITMFRLLKIHTTNMQLAFTWWNPPIMVNYTTCHSHRHPQAQAILDSKKKKGFQKPLNLYYIIIKKNNIYLLY